MNNLGDNLICLDDKEDWDVLGADANPLFRSMVAMAPGIRLAQSGGLYNALKKTWKLI